MVNLDKWEEISYNDIQKGDKIRVITTQGTVINDTRGVAYVNSWNGWSAPNSVSFLTSNDRFHPAPGGGRKIYRRKPKRDVITTFPENLGAVIEGIDRETGKAKRLVWDGQDWSDGVHSFVKNAQELKAHWHSFVLLSEGVK